MAWRELDEVLDQQPQEAVEVAPEWRDGIQVAYPAPVLGEAGGTNKLLSNVAVPAAYSTEICSFGRALKGSGASALASKGVFGAVGDIQYSGAAELTIFVLCRIESIASSTEAPIVRATDGAGGQGIALELYPATKKIRCLLATSGTTGWSGAYDETDSNIAADVPWVFAVAYRSGDRRVFSGPLGGPLSKFTRTNITGTLSANNGAPYYGGAAFSGGSTLYFPGWIGMTAVWTRALSDSEIYKLSQNPWQLFRRPPLPVFFGGAASGNATGTGAPASITTTPPTGAATGSATASGALAAITLAPAEGSASAATSATASGAFAALTIAPPAGTATGSATAAGTPAGITLAPAEGTASGTTAGGATAVGALAAITIAPPAGTATGDATAAGTPAGVTLTPPAGTAGAVTNATASGAFAAITLSPALGAATGAAEAAGLFAVVTITAPTSDMVPTSVLAAARSMSNRITQSGPRRNLQTGSRPRFTR